MIVDLFKIGTREGFIFFGSQIGNRKSKIGKMVDS
jgi:hypothetical protein